MKLYFVLLSLFYVISIRAQDSLALAETYYSKNEYEKAKLVLLNYIPTPTNTYQAHLLLGKVYGYLGEWEQAVNEFKNLKIKNPTIADIHYFYGAALAMQAKNGSKLKALGKLSDIESSFNKALELNPKHIDAHWALVTYYTELPGFLGGSLNKAKLHAKDLKHLSAVDGYLAYGYIYEYDNQYTQAESYYLKAHKIGNSKTTFQKLYHLYLNKLKNTDKANQLKQQFNSN